MRSLIVSIALIAVSTAQAQEYGWAVVARPAPVHGLYTVQFLDSLHGWCAGGDSIYWSTDGGTTWLHGQQNFGVITALSFSDTLNGWAVGFGGTICRTTDGGRSWSEQYVANLRNCLGTASLSGLKNITVGKTYNFFPDTGKIIQTMDGGLTWTERTLADSLQRLEHIDFVDSIHGWISSGSLSGVLAIARTTDGGTSWQVLQSPNYFQALFFIDRLRGWASAGSQIYRTSDGGESWQYLTFIQDPDPLSRSELATAALSFLDTLKGRAFGAIVYQGIITEGIYRTTDGGLNWFRESIGLTGDFGGVNDTKMLNAYHGWAVCNDGSVLRYQLITAVENPPGLPRAFWLHQNYPNPFNPTTTIEYEIPSGSHVKLVVYDLLGRRVQGLVDEKQEAGVHRVRLDGSALPSGVYYYRLQAGNFAQTKKLLLLR